MNPLVIDIEEEPVAFGIEEMRLEIYAAMKAKHEIFVSQETLPLDFVKDLSKMYDCPLNGEIKNKKTNFKFMVKENLPVKNQLAYWMITRESKRTQEYPHEWSFIVFISKSLWKKLWTPRAFNDPTEKLRPHISPRLKGMKTERGFITEEFVTSNSPFGALMFLVEKYIAVFITVTRYGHSSDTSEEIFLKTVEKTSEEFFGDSRESVWNKKPFSNKSYLFNSKTEELGTIIDNFVEGGQMTFVVWRTRNAKHPIIGWKQSEVQPLRVDLYQGKKIRV